MISTSFVNYADLNSFLSDPDIALIGQQNISKVSVKGIADILTKHSTENKESKGIKAHFKLDESGVIRLDRVEAAFEEKVEETIDENALKDALTKLGTTFGKLFGSPAPEESNVAC